jgi:hypothetical protein
MCILKFSKLLQLKVIDSNTRLIFMCGPPVIFIRHAQPCLSDMLVPKSDILVMIFNVMHFYSLNRSFIANLYLELQWDNMISFSGKVDGTIQIFFRILMERAQPVVMQNT